MKKRILIIDDKENSYTINNILKGLDFELYACESKEIAVEFVKNLEFNLIIVNILIGKLDGIELIKTFRKSSPYIPIIAVTDYNLGDFLQQSVIPIADDFVSFPINSFELVSRINNIFRIKEYEEKINKMYDDILNELKTAAKIQSYFLPEWFILERNILFSSTYSPSKYIGGDLYNIIKIDENNFILYIGDVSGHGICAALLMSAIKTIIEIEIDNTKRNFNISAALTRINRILSKDLLKDNYMTLLIGTINLKENVFKYISAGHPQLLSLNLNDKNVRVIDLGREIPLGWKNDYQYSASEEVTVALEPDNVYLMFTDGIYECSGKSNNQLGLDGLKEIIGSADANDIIVLPEFIKETLIRRNFDISKDDFTIISFCKNLFKKKDKRKLYSIKSDLRNVGAVGSKCESLAIEWTENVDLGLKVELVANELLNNLIIHSLELKPDENIILEIFFKDTITIKTYEQGNEWNFDEFSLLSTKSVEEKYEISGRGLKMIKSIVKNIKRTRYGLTNVTAIEF